MPEITLSTGKKVVTRELTAYHEYLMSTFLDVPIVDANNNMTAAYIARSGMLDAIFQVESVGEKSVDAPTDQKSLVLAFAHFTSKELGELITKLRTIDPGNENTAPGSTSALSSS